MKTNLTRFAGALLLALALNVSATAVPISGSIEIFGQVDLNGSNLGTATGAELSTALVFSAEGDFLPNVGASVNYNAFTWSPANTPISPLWTIAGPLAGSFDLLSLVVEAHDANHVDLAGYGILHLAGFDDTTGRWSYSITDSDGVGSGPESMRFGFLSSNSAVPDGGSSALLLGLTLVYLSVLSRRKLL